MKLSILSILLVLGGFLILCGLGTWQLQRLEWKTAIIDAIQAEYAKEPGTLAYKDLIPPDDAFFLRRGTFKGTLDHNKEIALGPRTHAGQPGYHIITPLYMKDGGTVLVNRGFSAEKPQTSGLTVNAQITGIARMPDWNAFTPENVPQAGQWFRPDIEEIAKAKDLKDTAPVLLYAEKASPPFQDTIIEQARWNPRNEHLQYALFWFTMAGILALIFCLYSTKKAPIKRG